MNRTVIKIEEVIDFDKIRIQFRIQEPVNVPDANTSMMLPYLPTDAYFSNLAALPIGSPATLDDLVQVVGEQVHTGLTTHQGVLHAIQQAVLNSGNGPRPIYIQTTALEAEAFPWEALFEPKEGFLSLDQNWPMARMPGIYKPGVIWRLYPEKLRIVAILGASGIDARPEFESLRVAVGAGGLNCELIILVAQMALKEYIEGLNLPWLSVDMIPNLDTDLLDRLKAIRPHVLHFFCHGSRDGYLEIATRNHLELGENPVYMTAANIRELSETWLVVLNCCEGATAGESNSIAYSLVNDGMPAAIGMREPIGSGDAHVFCRSFYRELVLHFKKILDSNQSSFVFEWANLMLRPRQALCGIHGGPQPVVAGRHKEWTLPVLYRRCEDLVIEISNNSTLSETEKRKRFSELNGLRETRGKLIGAPISTIRKIDDRIREIENELYI